MKKRAYKFLRDEFILFSPALAAAVLTLVVGIVMPRSLTLLLFLLIAAILAAGLLSFLPPIRAARARLVAARYIPDRDV
ncbi:MAG: hypothetical protein JF571_04170 [Asticcacaulis sp.]|nr:hypothetical protein [Asticcacaulis sp.]